MPRETEHQDGENISLVFTTNQQVNVEVKMEKIVDWFWRLSDENQAEFLIQVSRRADMEVGEHKANMQWIFVGGHLRKCECSDDRARDMIETWNDHGKLERERNDA